MSQTNKPALFGHCETLFAALKLDAKRDRKTKELIYTGHTTELAESIGLKGPAYSNAVKALKAMDCVERKQKGNRHQPTVWIIKDGPTFDKFTELSFNELPVSSDLPRRLIVLEQSVKNLERNVGDTDIQMALAGLSKSFKELDKKVVDLIQKGGG